MSGFPGFLSHLVGPFLPASNIPAEVEEATERFTVAVDETPSPSVVSASPHSFGRDAEPDDLRRARQRVMRAELERDLAMSDLLLREARYASQRPTWSAEQ